MKKIQNILLAVAAVLAVSCEKDTERLPFDNALEISSEGFGGGNGKAVVGGSASYWVDEEQVRVNGSTCVIAVSSEKAYVDAEGLSSPYVAIYPASILADEDADLSVPSVFNYEMVDGRQKLDVPMYSCNHFVDGCLYFKHLTGAITVMLTNNTNYPLEVDSIIVTNSAYQLSGSKSITLNAEGNDVAVRPAAKVGDNNRVVVLGNGKLTIPANTTGQANAVDVQVPVLPVGTNNSAFTIRVRTHRAGTVGAIIFQQSQVEGNKHLDQGKIGYVMAMMDGYRRDHMTYVGLFTINATGDKVFFSKGNLQWSYDTWRFAEHQYYTVGGASNNNTLSPTSNDWIDLFGWGTSGYDGKNPYMVGGSDKNYGISGGFAIAGTNYDWGEYNAISNGGNLPGIWRVMSGKDGEWPYVMKNRTNSTSGLPSGDNSSNARFTKATVCNVCGVILLPDGYLHPSDVGVSGSPSYNVSGADYSSFVVSDVIDWGKMESSGAVFLPSAGYRDETTVYRVNSYMYYWTSSCNNLSVAYYMNYSTSNEERRSLGCSVRLVQDL